MTDVFAAPHAPQGQSLALKVASVVRYRFFLYAGLLPYLLGAGWAYGIENTFRTGVFWLGLLGIFLSVVGVESFNEYFDAKMGTDRVFNPDADEYIPEWMFGLGVAAFALAAGIGFFLAWQGGWPIVLYTLLGGAAAVWYVGPPVRWVYRGLGETVIGLSYGPWMTLGSVHLHTHAFSKGALLASLVPGLLITALAVVNNIPDFHQDRLVGKKNLVVRLGRKNGRILYLALSAAGLSIIVAGAALGVFPKAALLAAAAGAPLWWGSLRAGRDTWDTPKLFVPAVRHIVQCYALTTAVFALAVAFGGRP
jgi:1,4-dihydroxy-2-naphthoate octaprenyltransferase